ncbi:hypothetical protein P43SY_002154 [Pythium insidiosum]|uniref:AIG1-type G domain-containing protein n=1 Tax=Pythium insidiosum TaxID=114742 RepID=A0AAD5LVX3_PYTIN|nr:hypothetical protein P43SY_002154 [Pythium insidiosum]
MTETWIFIGNPGVGKSTLLNCLLGYNAFASGLSYGGGLTTEVATAYDASRDIVVVDTPGLFDAMLGHNAADDITSLLQPGGKYKLCFFVRLADGRVVCEDLVALERVLDSIFLDDVPFSVIINDVKAVAYAELAKGGRHFKQVVAQINSGRYTTPHVLVVPRFRCLFEADNARVQLPSALRESLERFPTVYIPSDSVGDIYVPWFQDAVVSMTDTVVAMERPGEAEKHLQLVGRKRGSAFWPTVAKAAKVIAQVLTVTATVGII